MVHNAHNSTLHDPQCTRICATPTLHYVPPFHTHATTHPLASMCSPTLHQHTRFPGSEHKRKQNIWFEGNKTIASVCVCVCVCVRMHWRERERGGYTHTHWSKEYGEVIFFFLSFTSERYNQILPYSYDLFFFFFLVEETYHFFLFSSNQQHHLKFFKMCFFLLHAHTLYTKQNRRCN